MLCKDFIISAAANVSPLYLRVFQPFDYNPLFLGAMCVVASEREAERDDHQRRLLGELFLAQMSCTAPYLLPAGGVQAQSRQLLSSAQNLGTVTPLCSHFHLGKRRINCRMLHAKCMHSLFCNQRLKQSVMDNNFSEVRFVQRVN